MLMRAPANFEVDNNYDGKTCPACASNSFVALRPAENPMMHPVEPIKKTTRWHCLFCKFTQIKKSGDN